MNYATQIGRKYRPCGPDGSIARCLCITRTTLYTYINGDGSPKGSGAAVLNGAATRGRPAVAG